MKLTKEEKRVALSLKDYVLRDFPNNIDKLDWYIISISQDLSEEFIEKYKDKLDWNCISIYQKLSEEFIEKYKNKVSWYYISKHQKLSDNFIEKYRNYLNK